MHLRMSSKRYGRRRVDLLVSMFVHISGKTEREAREMILSTRTGQSIYQGDECFLYEQETANLYAVIVDLELNHCTDPCLKMFTVGRISEASDWAYSEWERRVPSWMFWKKY